ncbi:uncharacterized protein LOC110847399 isoform X2 [Folsomia candida]|uniref:uncharacterized protein LOC110847399 isoform X2 n=1 Tax=Folsomia candida TaxID=158441 RepID=UPI000B90A023|nr:uncharacterized protein LOC110847399 isoform X2 [Folsomia candida]
MKVATLIFLGHLALVYTLPLDSAARSARAAITKSSSEVGPDGKIKSASLAARTGDEAPAGVPFGGPVNGPAVVEPDHPSGPVVVDHPEGSSPPPTGPIYSVYPVNPPAPEGVSSPVPVPEPTHVAPSLPNPHPTHKGGSVSVQKVNAKANMDHGTAVATASNRKRNTNIQQSAASAKVAIAKTQNNSPVDGLSFQKSDALGEKLAVATSENSGRDLKRDVSKNVQGVQAHGFKAIASAAETKGAALNLQNVSAEGGDFAVAKATSGGSSAPVLPPPQEK